MQDSIEDYIRISRNTKDATPSVRRESLINAQIKQECDTKVMQIVQFAIDGKMRPDALFKCLPYINQDHYQDIVEERAVSKLCGYPLCSKRIPDMPKKQFYISTKSNKVYDITDRKNYCSNYCYRANIHVKTQIDTTPLWLRKHQEKRHFTLLHKSERGLPGEVVVDQFIKKPVLESLFTSVSDFAHISLDEAEEYELTPQEEDVKKVKKPRKFQKNPMKTINENEEEDTSDDTNKEPKRPQPESTFNKPKVTTAKQKENKLEQTDVESLLRKCFKEWFTLETYIFIHGEENVKKTLDGDALSQYFDTLHVADLQMHQQKRYVDICRKLHLKELADDKFDNTILGHKLKPIPDYQELKHTSQEVDLKVKAFYSGELQVLERQNVGQKNDSIKETDQEEGSPAVLPLVEVNSQTAMRRKIFLNSLNKTVQTLSQTLRLDVGLIWADVQRLVKTFKLKADNIVFKQVMWNYIAVVLLKILCLKDDHLRSLLETDKSKELMSSWLTSLPHKDRLIDDVLQQLSSTDAFVTNYITCT